jgi:periplasmic protein CpxP/Spy
MKKKQLIQFLGAGALAAGMAFAQVSPATPAEKTPSTANPGTRRNFRQQRFAKLSQELNLTDAQQTQAKAIFSQARQEAQPLRAQLKENREALRAAVKADNQSEIRKLSATRGNLMGKMAAIHSEAAAKFYQTLTSEQRMKADQLHQQARERWHNRRRYRLRPLSTRPEFRSSASLWRRLSIR